MLIGEVYLPVSDLVRYYGTERSEVHLPFNFQLVQATWDAPHLRRVVDEYEASVASREWPNWVLGNHDQPRVASRIGGPFRTPMHWDASRFAGFSTAEPWRRWRLTTRR